MATGEFSDLATKVCYAAQRNPSVTYDLTRAKELVNQAVMSISNNGEPWRFLEFEGQWETTAGSDTYSMSSIATAIGAGSAAIGQIVAMVNDTDGGIPLQSMAWEHLERLAASTQDGDPQGWPSAFATWGYSKVRLYPKPDAAYDIGTLVRLRAVELSADDSTPLLPLDWRDRLIIPHAAANLLLQQGGNQAMSLADRYWRNFERDYMEFRSAFATAAKPTFSLISPGWDDDLPGSYSYEVDW